MSFLTDHELYERLIIKDRSALELLYDRYERILYALTLKLTTRHDLAESALSEVFKYLWEMTVPFDLSIKKFRTYLLSLAQEIALRLVKPA